MGQLMLSTFYINIWTLSDGLDYGMDAEGKGIQGRRSGQQGVSHFFIQQTILTYPVSGTSKGGDTGMAFWILECGSSERG